MKPHLLFILAVTLLHLSLVHSTTYFVTPRKTCGKTCPGTAAQPFDNLLIAIKSVQSASTQSTLLLLNDPTNPHYLLQKELVPPPGNTFLWEFPDYTQFQVKNLIIKPLYCNEEPAKSDHSWDSKCLQPGQKLTVFVKSTKFTLSILKNLQILGITFNAIEDIRIWNPDSAELSSCLYNRKRCCQNPSTLKCQSHGNYSNILGSSGFADSSIFTINSGSLSLQSADFVNFMSPNVTSLIQTKNSLFTLAISQSRFDSLYFDKGVIFHRGDSLTANTSTISLNSISFNNYNAWDLQRPHVQSEGYLFLSEGKFSGKLSLISGSFANITTSQRGSCWVQSKQNYNRPMTKYLQSDPWSRSDVWTLYDSDHTKTTSMSSLIFISEIDGGISIADTIFSNIIGTSGSVLRVDNITSKDNWFTISNSSFDGNFAYDGFANIRIAKKSNPTFSSMVECPHIQVLNSNFTNAQGCPGAYGNVLFLCYWDTAAPITGGLSDYSLGADPDIILKEDPPAYIRIQDSLFQHNRLAISNSLAIIGGYSTILEGNTFEDNGGTTDNIAFIYLNESYIFNRYPNVLNEVENMNMTAHFGQSTAVYFDRFVRFRSFNNIYRANYGPWEGSLALASSLTLKNWIRLPDTLKFVGDYYGEHTGVPEDIKHLVDDIGIADNYFTDSVISLSIDHKGVLKILNATGYIPGESSSNVIIPLEDVKFVDNRLSFNYLSYTYNLKELQQFITTGIAAQLRYRNGLLKLMTSYETLDVTMASFQYDSDVGKTGLTFSGGLIQDNKLLTPGCMFLTSWAQTYIVDSVNINQNGIDTKGEGDSSIILIDELGLSETHLIETGIFCLWASDALQTPGKIKLIMNNVKAYRNNGILVDVLSYSSGILYLSNSLFIENSSQNNALFYIFDYSAMFSVNNTFAKSFTKLGNLCIIGDTNYTGITNNFLFNIGKVASIMLSFNTNTGQLTETGAGVYGNDVSDISKVFYSSVSPSVGLYFLSSSKITHFASNFSQNHAYTGLFTASGSDVKLKYCQIFGNRVLGVSLIGSFISLADLVIENSVVDSNYLSADSTFKKAKIAFIILSSATFTATNNSISSAFTDSMLVFGNTITAKITNLTLVGASSHQASQPLFLLSFSTMEVTDMECTSTTGLFKLIETDLTLNQIFIMNMMALHANQFIVDMFSSSIIIQDMDFFGVEFSISGSSPLPLISGQSSNLYMLRAHFDNPRVGVSSIISMKGEGNLQVSDSTFLYTSRSVMTNLLMELNGLETIAINKCVFKGVENLMIASDVNHFFFVENTVLTNSLGKLLNIDSTNDITMFSNQFINIQKIIQSSSDLLYYPVEDYYELKSPGPIYLTGSQITVTDVLSSAAIYYNTFFTLKGLNGVVEVIAKKYLYSLQFESNHFVNNTASSGAAIFLSSLNPNQPLPEQKEEAPSEPRGLAFGSSSSSFPVPTAAIDHCVFIQNKAITYKGNPGIGGAIYLTSPDHTQQETIIEQCYFINNTAEVKSGAIYFGLSPPKVLIEREIIHFSNNYAAGKLNHISSYPVKLTLLSTSIPTDKTSETAVAPGKYTEETEFHKWSNIASGLTTYESYTFALLDIFGQIVYDDTTSLLEIYPTGFTGDMRTSFTNKIVLPAQNGLYKLENFKFSYQTGESLNVSFNSTAIPTSTLYLNENLLLTPINSVTVQITFRGCSLGEVVHTTEDGLSVCQECQTGFWQIDPSGTAVSCDACDVTEMYCYGGNNVGPRPGYWRMNETADIVLECPRAESCLGNEFDFSIAGSTVTLNPTGECAETYTGNLCNSCIDGYAKAGEADSKCINCSTNAFAYIKLVLILGFQAIMISFGVKETMKLAQSYSQDNHVKANNSVLLRIIINYLQIISLLASIDVEWPSLLGGLLSTNSKFSSLSEEVFSVNCLFIYGAKSLNVEAAYLKTLLIVLSPFGFVLCGVLFWICYFKLKKEILSHNKNFTNKVITTIVIIGFNLQPTVIKTAFALFQCTNLYRSDAPINYLTMDYNIQCWHGDHSLWAFGLGLTSLIIWIALLPSFIIIILKKNQKKLNTAQIAKKYSFIYNGYSNKKYYWELVVMIRKISIICIIIFAGMHSTNLQIFLCFIAIFLSYMIHVAHNPYSNHALNELEKASLFSLGVVTVCALYFQIIESEKAFDVLVLILGVFGNLYFLVYFARLFLLLQIVQLKNNQKAMKILGYINHRFCCCLRQPKLQMIVEKVRLAFSTSLESTLFLSKNTLKKSNSFSKERPLAPVSIFDDEKVMSFKDQKSQEISCVSHDSPDRRKLSISQTPMLIGAHSIRSPAIGSENSIKEVEKEMSFLSLAEKIPEEESQGLPSVGQVSQGNGKKIHRLLSKNLSKKLSALGDASERRSLRSDSLVTSSRITENRPMITAIEVIPDEGSDEKKDEEMSLEMKDLEMIIKSQELNDADEADERDEKNKEEEGEEKGGEVEKDDDEGELNADDRNV